MKWIIHLLGGFAKHDIDAICADYEGTLADVRMSYAAQLDSERAKLNTAMADITALKTAHGKARERIQELETDISNAQRERDIAQMNLDACTSELADEKNKPRFTHAEVQAYPTAKKYDLELWFVGPGGGERGVTVRTLTASNANKRTLENVAAEINALITPDGGNLAEALAIP